VAELTILAVTQCVHVALICQAASDDGRFRQWEVKQRQSKQCTDLTELLDDPVRKQLA